MPKKGKGKGLSQKKNDRKLSNEKHQQKTAADRQTIIDRASELGYTRLFHAGSTSLDFAILDGSKIIQRVTEGDNTWSVEICQSKLNEFHNKTAEEIFRILSNNKPCVGNDKSSFASIETSKLASAMIGKDHTLRHITCKYLVPISSQSHRCDECSRLRSTMMKSVSRAAEQSSRTGERSAIDSCTPLFSLTSEELKQRCINLKREVDKLKYKIYKLEHNNVTNNANIEVNEPTNNTINQQIAANPLPDGTLAHLFIEEQKKYAKNKGKGMRWHPMIIRWALTLHNKSKSAYRAITKPGFMNLPSERTLYEYYHYREYSAGVDVQGIMDFSQSRRGEDFSLLMDEMKIKEGIVYSEKSGEITGYIAIGDLQHELDKYKDKDGKHDKPTATHALVMLIRGIKKADTFAASTFFTRGATAYELYWMVWETILYAEVSGLHIRVLVSDGASANRSFAQLHKATQSQDELIYRTTNRFNSKRWLYFISDAPHLVKTTRNCIENSGGNLNSRNLVLHGQPITWGQITNLYEEMAHSTGLTMLHKLTSSHTNLTSYTRMKVKFAVQILSSSVANALELKNDNRLTSTIELIRKVDKAFDILNVKAYRQGLRTANSNKMEFSSTEDPRFKWLEQEFLKWLDDWEAEVSAIPGLTPADRSRCLLSVPTRKGWQITCRAFIALTKELLEEGYNYVLSEHLTCQDAVEQYFAKQRDSTGGNSAPNMKEFLSNNLLFQVTKQTAIAPNTGNTTTEQPSIEIDDTPLPKRAKK